MMDVEQLRLFASQLELVEDSARFHELEHIAKVCGDISEQLFEYCQSNNSENKGVKQ